MGARISRREHLSTIDCERLQAHLSGGVKTSSICAIKISILSLYINIIMTFAKDVCPFPSLRRTKIAIDMRFFANDSYMWRLCSLMG